MESFSYLRLVYLVVKQRGLMYYVLIQVHKLKLKMDINKLKIFRLGKNSNLIVKFMQRLLDTILKKHGIVSMGEVSGEHLAEYQDEFIKVMDHPESYEIEKKR